MKIAMISTPFVPVPPAGYGGTELVVHELTEGLLERGHEVTLFATADSHTAGKLRHLYPRAQWPVDPMTELNHVTWALRQVRDGTFDAVHVHSAAALAVARFLPDLPIFYTLHHARDEKLSAYYRFFPDIRYIAISADQRAREISLPRVSVIHHGLAVDRFEWTEEPADFVAFVGRFSPVKGPHVAIDVAARAGVHIRVGGETHPVDAVFGEEEVRPRLTLPHVTALGPVRPEVKIPLLRDARALLFPIDWNEPFGLILIEAMLSGCPPIAFPRGSVPELVEDGVTGFIVADEDEMVELLRPGSALDRFDRWACRGQARARFGADRMVEAHEQLYTRAVTAFPGSTMAEPEPLWPMSARAPRRLPDALEES
jgi:glycosyltransferase involved in cell wall biosynthesis